VDVVGDYCVGLWGVPRREGGRVITLTEIALYVVGCLVAAKLLEALL
jgi:hypothetical protein